MTSALQRIGYTPDKHIIAIDDNGGPQAARLIWTLHAFGITQCSFLNGGMAAWMDDINETDQTIEAPEASSYEATLQGGNSMSRQQIIDQLDTNLQIVDARTLGEFNGEDIRSERGGHVPNAIHFEWSQIKNKQTMKLKPLEEIAALFEQAGIKADKETVSYCQTHMRSSVLWMVMTALGFENPKGYPGAWSDWGNQSDTPIA
jgi:thiosulfate/3-mercaptopyruvate sulfurtransferase